MEIGNKYRKIGKIKIELSDDNKYEVKFIYNCLGIIQLCKDNASELVFPLIELKEIIIIME